jgi:ribosomal protein S18 acetylase RimI-like enzyme
MITYRPATIDDCPALGDLICAAYGGVADYLFDGLSSEKTAAQMLSEALARDRRPRTFRNVFVAESREAIVGMVLSFPAVNHRITPDMEAVFPPERLAHLADVFGSRVLDSWYVDAICVQHSFRGRGIGRRLIWLAQERAFENGFDTLSLLVFSDSVAAFQVYTRIGFTLAKTIRLDSNAFIRHKGGCFLLRWKFI